MAIIENDSHVSYYIVGHVPRTISAPCGLFQLKKGGTISCVVTGPRQPRYSRDLEKLLRDHAAARAPAYISANLHACALSSYFLTEYTLRYVRALVSIVSHYY